MRGELYINGTLADLDKEIQAAITYAITDIKKPETRNGSFSKTVIIPGTKTLNVLMTNIYDIAYSIQTSGIVNFTPDFNPNLKAGIVFLVDGLEQFRGYMKLMNVNRSQQDLEKIEYEVVFFGDVATIFGNLGDAKMSALNLSEFNHTYNKANQKATWTNTNYGSGYVYPMINYGGVNPSSWDVNNFYPAVYLKTYWDKIFEYAGFVCSGTFPSSAEFKRFVIGFNGDALRLTASQIENRVFSATTSTNTSGVANPSSPLTETLIFDSESVDVGGVYDNTTGIFTATSAGYYDFQFSGSVVADAVTSVTIANNFSVVCFINFIHTRGATVTTYPGGSFFVAASGTFSSGYNFGTFPINCTTPINIQIGDTVKVQRKANVNFSSTGSVGFNLLSGARFNDRISNTQVTDGDTVDMSMVIPFDTKMSDFILWVIRKYNLFVEPDRTQANKLTVETYDDFYAGGTTVVLEGTDANGKEVHLLDVSKQVQITPMGALDAIRYVLTESDDTDYWNKFYKDKFGETYGQKNFDVTNDFVKGVNENRVGFAPTPLIGSAAHDRIYPEIYNFNNGVQQPMKSKLRILYWGGALPTNYPWQYTSVTGTTTETTYPYAGHLDNPYTPSIDLNFWMPREIYYLNSSGTTQYTTNNTFNRFHKRHLTEITDRNSKMLTGWFYLRPKFIHKLSFRDRYYLDNHYFRLQKIFEYNGVSEGPTKVQFLKIKEGQSFVPVSKVLNGTFNELLAADNPAPVYSGTVSASLDNPGSSMSIGNNYISRSAVGATVTGSQNRIGDNTQNVSVLNSSGVTVLPNLRNVFVSGSNNLVITESDVSYVNGVRSAGMGDIVSVTTSMTIRRPGIYYCNGSISVTLNESIGLNGVVVIKDITAGVHTLSILGGGYNIDGLPGKASTVQYTSYTIQYVGAQYYII